MSKFKRFIVAADNHGELGCPDAIKKILDFNKTWKANYRIHLGDVWDFGCLRRGASPEDKAHGITDDYSRGMEFLEQYRPTQLCLGNHDDRIWMNVDKCADGILRERCQELAAGAERRFKQLKIDWIPYSVDQALRMPEGGPRLVHGFASGQNCIKKHHYHYGPCLHGHVHRPGTFTADTLDGSQSLSVGCLGDIKKMSYANRYLAKQGWRQGFAYGIINTRTGAWNAWNVTKENEDWISPQGIL